MLDEVKDRLKHLQAMNEFAYWKMLSLQGMLGTFIIGAGIGVREAGLIYTAENTQVANDQAIQNQLAQRRWQRGNISSTGGGQSINGRVGGQNNHHHHHHHQQSAMEIPSTIMSTKNKKEWYTYFRKKYYVMGYAGMKNGMKFALKLGGLCSAFVGADVLLDQLYKSGGINFRSGSAVQNVDMSGDYARVPVYISPLAGCLLTTSFAIYRRFGLRDTVRCSLLGVLSGLICYSIQWADSVLIRDQPLTFKSKYEPFAQYALKYNATINDDTNLDKSQALTEL
ncbi:hypothetical protein MP228_002502 [Amoeboaphelidium protococcarum]|nr:hypothetical protein MP228_002502 [Amoeboaphelidium protococcarum]